jgi:hypothetical protein
MRLSRPALGGGGSAVAWVVANAAVLLYLAGAYLRLEHAATAAVAEVERRAGGGSSGAYASGAAGELPLPGGASTDSALCSGADAPSVDAAGATAAMRGACPTAYANTTVCEDVGPACVSGDDITLYAERWQPDPSDGWWRRSVGPDALRKLDTLMYWASWGGANADGYNGNLLRFSTPKTGSVAKVWPAGRGAAPPVPFSTCTHPLALYWDFPENFYHTLASYALVWHAVRAGAISPDVSVALGLPQPYLTRGGGSDGSGDALPEYLTAPLGAVFRRTVAPLWGLAAQGQPGGGGTGAQGALTGRLGLPPVRCFARFTVCTVAGYSALPPRDFYAFLQEVQEGLAGRPRQYGAGTKADVPYAWPAAAKYVTGADGTLRVTLAVRSEGTRRVLNRDELVQLCAATTALTVGAGVTVPLSCRMHAFGGGFAADAAAMRETDVLVGVHGAGLTNLGFLRPGSTVVEVRPMGMAAADADRFYRPLARGSGCLKWWAVMLHERYQSPGSMQSSRRGNPSKYERDRDVLLPWEGLASALTSALGMSYEEWREREPRAATHVA